MRPQAVTTLVTTDTGETSLIVGGTVGSSTGTGGQVTGPVAIGRRVPSVTTEKLYNSTGTLKWNGSTVPTGSGTTGVLPKFTGAGTLGDSVLTESGGNVSSSGGIGDSVGLLSTVRAGGIGVTSQAQYDTLYASSSTQLARVPNGTTGQVLTATTSGAPSWQTLTSAGAWFSTIFETSTRCNPFNYSSGFTPTFNNLGMLCDCSNARGSAGASIYFAGSMASAGPALGLYASFTITQKGTDGTVFIGNTLDAGISISTDTGSMTPKHWGFKVVWSASGAMVLSATQSDGTVESATVMDSGILTTDTVTVYAAVNSSGTSISYYYWKNGGTISAATTISSRFPTSCGRALECSITDNSTATQSKVQFYGAGVKYA